MLRPLSMGLAANRFPRQNGLRVPLKIRSRREGKAEMREKAVAPAHPCARDIGASLHGTVYTSYMSILSAFPTHRDVLVSREAGRRERPTRPSWL